MTSQQLSRQPGWGYRDVHCDGHLFRVRTANGGRLHLSGELDIATTPMLLAAAHRSDQGLDLTIDLSAVRFVDAAGINALVCIHEDLRTAARTLVITGASPRITRVFRIARAGWLLAHADHNILDRLAAAMITAASAHPNWKQAGTRATFVTHGASNHMTKQESMFSDELCGFGEDTRQLDAFSSD